ncbi:MAG: GldM family protein [Bacteroidota bacterium]
MKTLSKMILILFAVLFSFQLFSQTENSAVVSADRMNVFYIGIDNPVSIAVPGVTNDKIKVFIKNGSITGSDGSYIVKVDADTESIIYVTAEIMPGEIKAVGSDTFRIRKIPDPTPCIGNYCTTSFNISKAELMKNAEVSISLNLPFELKFEVVSFTFTYMIEKDSTLVMKKNTGNKFRQDMINDINNMEDGDKIYIEDIKAKGPDGTVRSLSAMNITIKLLEKK